jgi:hypothetical protein
LLNPFSATELWVYNAGMPDNSGKNSGKKRVMPIGKPFVKGQSGNPKRGESWAEIIKRIGDMTPVEAADHANEIAKQLRKIGGALTLKEAVVVRVYAALLFEPQASLLNTFMERAEGKIVQPVEGNIGLTWSEFVKTDEETSTKEP